MSTASDYLLGVLKFGLFLIHQGNSSRDSSLVEFMHKTYFWWDSMWFNAFTFNCISPYTIFFKKQFYKDTMAEIPQKIRTTFKKNLRLRLGQMCFVFYMTYKIHSRICDIWRTKLRGQFFKRTQQSKMTESCIMCYFDLCIQLFFSQKNNVKSLPK